MIPRYQRVVFWVIAFGIFLMAALLLRGCVRNHERILAMRDQSPIAAPSNLPVESVNIAHANDDDATITLDAVSLPLPAESAQRAEVLLDRVFADAAQSGSAHPLPAAPALSAVFLVPLPLSTPANVVAGALNSGDQPQTERVSPYGDYHAANAQLAVVNLTKAFADQHPSGILAEDLTLRVVIATLHANFPQVEQVRFLVDGTTRPTLAGHADLTRPYSVQDPAKAVHILSPTGNPI